jgi:membrane dipeptidase
MNKPYPAHNFPAIDGHVDLVYDLLRHHPGAPLRDVPSAWVSLPKLDKGNIRIIVSAIYCMDTCNGPENSSANFLQLLEYADRNLTGMNIVSCSESLSACFRGSENPGAVLLLENADALLEYRPEELWNRGFRIVGLTHVGRNRLGDGNAVEHPEGLSSAGRELVGKLDKLGFAIDTAHLSEPCFRDVVEIFSGPLLSTHTGLRYFHDIPRNLTDEQLRTIVDRQGVVGIAACPEILSADGEADITLLFQHIDRIVQKFGAESVAIGSDFGGYDSTCKGFEDHSQFPALAILLSQAGYPHSAVEGILGKNWFRFFEGFFPQFPIV